MTFAVLLSAYMLLRDNTAQINAGSQPISVHCNIKHIIPEKTFPCNIKLNHGRKNAKMYLIVIFLFVWFCTVYVRTTKSCGVLGFCVR